MQYIISTPKTDIDTLKMDTYIHHITNVVEAAFGICVPA